MDSPVVETRYGKVHGFTISSSNGSHADIFLGVPFAKPPLGELRFEKPVPPYPWTDVYRATKFADACTAPEMRIDMFGDTFSEDCLYLNIYAPREKTEPWEADAPRRWAIVSPSLWIVGIIQLHNSERFEVEYESNRYLRIICLKLVQLCEKFERGEISEFVEHFKFTTSRQIALPFKDDNKIASEVKVGDYEWDIYRFRNAATGERLTACVGYELSEEPLYSVLHIVKGDAYPDASFGA